MGKDLSILAIGVEKQALDELYEYWDKKNTIVLHGAKEVENLIEDPDKYNFCAAFVGSETDDITADEIAQFFRVQYTDRPVFFITKKRELFSRKELLKNGFTDVFIEPFDGKLLTQVFNEIAGIKEDVSAEKFQPVRLIDIEPNTVLEFNVWIYFPVNKKHIRLLNAGQKIDEKRLAKLKKHNIGSIYLIREDLPKFYDYVARKLNDLSKAGDALSETERTERLKGSVRTLFGSIFDEGETATVASGREMMKHCQKIVANYIENELTNKLFIKIRNAIADNANPYSHSLTTSTFAALFSIGTGIGKPDELAIAAILHDIGLIDVPAKIQSTKESERTPEEQMEYIKHPELSIKFIKNKRIILSNNALNAIKDHHERWDGKGYPHKKEGKRISNEAQILGLADHFDYLTRIEEGKPYISAYAAIQIIKKDGAYNPEIVAKISELIPPPAVKDEEQVA